MLWKYVERESLKNGSILFPPLFVPYLWCEMIADIVTGDGDKIYNISDHEILMEISEYEYFIQNQIQKFSFRLGFISMFCVLLKKKEKTLIRPVEIWRISKARKFEEFYLYQNSLAFIYLSFKQKTSDISYSPDSTLRKYSKNNFIHIRVTANSVHLFKSTDSPFAFTFLAGAFKRLHEVPGFFQLQKSFSLSTQNSE